MDFITWWFDKHYVLSTAFMPLWCVVWAVYKGLAVRAVVSFAVWMSHMLLSMLLGMLSKS